MAYVVWRVLMKKYSKVRLGLQKGSSCPHSTSNIVSFRYIKARFLNMFAQNNTEQNHSKFRWKTKSKCAKTWLDRRFSEKFRIFCDKMLTLRDSIFTCSKTRLGWQKKQNAFTRLALKRFIFKLQFYPLKFIYSME